MSGRRLLLDTNAVVLLLRGEGGLEASLRSAQWVGISIISYLEFLSFQRLVAGVISKGAHSSSLRG